MCLNYYHYHMEKEMNSNLVNLVKLCVGAETINDLTDRQDNLNRKDKNRRTHVTRMWPKRGDEILNGGSLFWVIKGFIQARQKIIGLEEVFGQDNIRRCTIVLDPEILLTTSVEKRPFQGWRYLEKKNSPDDTKYFDINDTTDDQEIISDLHSLGLF